MFFILLTIDLNYNEIDRAAYCLYWNANWRCAAVNKMLNQADVNSVNMRFYLLKRDARMAVLFRTNIKKYKRKFRNMKRQVLQ